MRLSIKTIMLALAVTIVCCIAVDTALAQCVKCENNSNREGCFECVSSGATGALSCPTVTCQSCTVSGVCGYGRQMASGLATSQRGGISAQKATVEFCGLSTPAQEIAPIMFDNEIIKEVASLHPRFAVTLAVWNESGGIGNRVNRHYWTPMEIKTSDVEWLLKPENGVAAFFHKTKEQAKVLNKKVVAGGLNPVIYDISVTDHEATATRVIIVRVVSGSTVDPAYSALEVKMVKGADGGKVTKTNASWRVY